MPEQFISEPVVPRGGTFDTRRMAGGEPGLPAAFRWRGREFAVEEVLETWKETAPCRSGSDEQYTRKHWFRIRTTDGREMKLYFERQARSKREQARRWWLYTVTAHSGSA